jgi:hypothetical protein
LRVLAISRKFHSETGYSGRIIWTSLDYWWCICCKFCSDWECHVCIRFIDLYFACLLIIIVSLLIISSGYCNICVWCCRVGCTDVRVKLFLFIALHPFLFMTYRHSVALFGWILLSCHCPYCSHHKVMMFVILD